MASHDVASIIWQALPRGGVFRPGSGGQGFGRAADIPGPRGRSPPRGPGLRGRSPPTDGRGGLKSDGYGGDTVVKANVEVGPSERPSPSPLPHNCNSPRVIFTLAYRVTFLKRCEHQ